MLEAIQKSSEFLARKGVESPRLQSELLLAHVLRTQRLKLYLDFGRELKEAEEVVPFRDLIKRRGAREPLQHILGTANFCGIEIEVNKDVLIPRPETEMLAEEGWKFLAERAGPEVNAVRFADFGTGSGCIAIALAVKCPTAKGWGIERSSEALATARRNLQASTVGDRVTFVEGDSLEALNDERVDLVISNPPYIPRADIKTLQEEVREFDPHGALDGGEDGLDYYRYLAEAAGNYLLPGGKLMVEFGDGQENGIKKILEANKWVVERIVSDYNGKPRLLAASCV